MAIGFREMYVKAYRRDHSAYESLPGLAESFKTADICDLVSLADSLYEVRSAFLKNVDKRIGPPQPGRPIIKRFCSVCGDAYCLHSEYHQFVPYLIPFGK